MLKLVSREKVLNGLSSGACLCLHHRLRKQTTPPASRRPGAPVSMDSLPDGTLLHIFATVWSGRPSYNDNDARRQLGDIALVCRQWRVRRADIPACLDSSRRM